MSKTIFIMGLPTLYFILYLPVPRPHNVYYYFCWHLDSRKTGKYYRNDFINIVLKLWHWIHLHNFYQFCSLQVLNVLLNNFVLVMWTLLKSSLNFCHTATFVNVTNLFLWSSFRHKIHKNYQRKFTSDVIIKEIAKSKEDIM